MKIALVVPAYRGEGEKGFYDYRFFARFLFSKLYISYPLSIPTLAALTPPEHDIRVFDENVEAIDYTWDADLVGITVRTMFAQRAYSISEAYRKTGAKTVLGGIHPSMCPEEAAQHCDSVVVGEAEHVWHTLLQDLQQGTLKQVYRSDQKADLTAGPMPARSLLSRTRYLSDIVQTTKGCPFDCEFCSVHAFDGQTIRHRTVEQIVREIQDIQRLSPRYKKKNAIFFGDDNIIANKRFARELFQALKPLNINWMCQASMDISKEHELLQLMSDSGCGAVFIGFESTSDENLARMHKGINRRYNYTEVIQKIQSYGILVHGSFVIGYEFDTQSTFDELIEFIHESRLLVPILNIMTPFPGTRLFKRLEEEGRLLHTDWSQYDTKHVVFKPGAMSPEALYQGYRRIAREVYSFEAIFKRLSDYWAMDFWKHPNETDPVRLKYRLLFALRLCTLLVSGNVKRSLFILKILPRVFDRRVRVSSILAQMAYNDFAYTL
ncbi:MAG: B12-binding domain-containing radical SAM protein [Phycisphaerae bacterium]|nr:B12-binding domain-containing radical SAM protein [Phycisphaerae bacterium]